MSESVFEFDDVSRIYMGAPAVAKVSFSIAAGSNTAILGPSGSGKSTILRLLAGLDAPTSGRILLDGNVASLANRVCIPPHRRRIGMVFQDLALWPNLTAEANVMLALSATRLGRGKARARAREALSLCGISQIATRMPGQISGGEQQRVALARAIVGRPEFLLLDEPFGGVDVLAKAQLVAEISRLAVAQRLTIVLISHDPWEIRQLCSRAVVLEQGQVKQSGELDAVLAGGTGEFAGALRDAFANATQSNSLSARG